MENGTYIDDLEVISLSLDTGAMSEASVNDIHMSGIGTVTIHVYGGEGEIPHFHIRNKNGSFETCVRLYEAKYFKHQGKSDSLNSKQMKFLDKAMRTRHKDLVETNWEFACVLWDSANKTSLFSKSKKQPDYTKLEEG